MAGTLPNLHMLIQQKLDATILKAIRLQGTAVVFHRLGVIHSRGLKLVEGEIGTAGDDNLND